MGWLRCPRCTHAFRAPPGPESVCPACGLRARTPEADVPVAARPTPDAVVGRPRRAMGFLGLWIVTLGIYAFAYFRNTFLELDRQHGRPHSLAYWSAYVVTTSLAYAAGVTWAALWFFKADGWLTVDLSQTNDLIDGLWLPIATIAGLWLIGTVFWIAYVRRGLLRLQDYRRSRDMPSGIGPAAFFAWSLLLPFVGGAIAVVRLTASSRMLWVRIYEEKGIALPGWIGTTGATAT